MLMCVFLMHIAQRPRVQRAPGLPRALLLQGRVRPLFFGAERFAKTRADVRREDETAYSIVIARLDRAT